MIVSAHHIGLLIGVQLIGMFFGGSALTVGDEPVCYLCQGHGNLRTYRLIECDEAGVHHDSRIIRFSTPKDVNMAAFFRHGRQSIPSGDFEVTGIISDTTTEGDVTTVGTPTSPGIISGTTTEGDVTTVGTTSSLGIFSGTTTEGDVSTVRASTSLGILSESTSGADVTTVGTTSSLDIIDTTSEVDVTTLQTTSTLGILDETTSGANVNTVGTTSSFDIISDTTNGVDINTVGTTSSLGITSDTTSGADVTTVRATSSSAQTSTTMIASSGCPQDWTLFEGHCYRYIKTIQLNFTDSEEHCSSFSLAYSRGVHLVRIDSVAENTFLGQLWANRTGNTTAGESWIGYSDRISEGTWLWIDGTGGDYNNWSAGEPNNGKNANQHCGCMWRLTTNVLGEWDDQPCYKLRYFFCEFSM